MNDLCVLGFDPIFLDIIVSPLDDNQNKLENFPQIGEHIPNTDVKILPGGNAFNVARVLTKITQKVYFFGAIDPFFDQLVQDNIPALNCRSTRNKKSNVTIAVQFLSGEIQMNSITSSFSVGDVSLESLVHLLFSKIVPFSNIGLNKDGPSLFDFLTSFFINFYKYCSSTAGEKNLQFISNFFETNKGKFEFLQSTNINSLISDYSFLSSSEFDLDSKIFYFDPSSLKSFTSWKWLDSFFTDKFRMLPGYKIISLNEHEFNLMKANQINFNLYLKQNNNYLIVHESHQVTIFQHNLSEQIILPVPKIPEESIVSSVGAGDSFNAGLIFEFSNSFDITLACKSGIKIAQKYLTNSL